MQREPRVSILMPTFRHAWIIQRALASLFWQDYQDWELVVVDDGSPDDTTAVVAEYLDGSRIRYHRLDHNQGLGAALNFATSIATGEYLCYLPSDDVYFPGHLRRLVEVLERRPEVYLAYGGVQVHHSWRAWTGATLRGDGPVGREAEALTDRLFDPLAPQLPNYNILALVQVMHRRTLEDRVRWSTRDEVVTDALEPDYWRALLAHGAVFASAGGVSCEWVDHPDQHHKIISETHDQRPPGLWSDARSGRGLAAYRAYYGVPDDVPLNWQPSRGIRIDQRRNAGEECASAGRQDRLTTRPSGLRILLVGELGFNPDRIQVLAREGHELYGLWIRAPETWDSTGAAPGLDIHQLGYARGWRSRVRDVRPDVIYALLNYHAVPLVHEVIQARFGVPVVFHFKESPFACLRYGLWPALVEILDGCEGQVFISTENFDWFRSHLPNVVGCKPALILDGDLPSRRWMTGDYQQRMSDRDGQVHTVCAGRPVGLRFDELIRHRIHLHLYGDHIRPWYADAIRAYRDSGYLHLHPTVEPSHWVRELSRYDAAWVHDVDSYNGGDIRTASWCDLNLPARIGTYAAAGVPLLVRYGGVERTSIRSLIDRYGIGISFRTTSELAAHLTDRRHVDEVTQAVRNTCDQLSFDGHVCRLVNFLSGKGDDALMVKRLPERD
jgi:glycosyltransferase involved in cell wall biosynthesis